MPSGKQVLLRFLLDLSTRKDQSGNVDDELRAAMLHHTSTSSESLEMLETIAWRSKSNDAKGIRGIATIDSGILLSDILESLVDVPEIPKQVGERFPNLSQTEFDHATACLWYLVSALQWYQQLVPLETKLTETDRKEWIQKGLKTLQSFRDDPW